MGDRYQLRYLQLFQEDLAGIIKYISEYLHNPTAAIRLIDLVEEKILERAHCPKSFEPYPSSRERTHNYYRIYINNYTIFYVIIDDVMEVRRMLYSPRNLKPWDY